MLGPDEQLKEETGNEPECLRGELSTLGSNVI